MLHSVFRMYNSFQWHKHKRVKNQNLKIWKLNQKQLVKSACRCRCFHVERPLSEVMMEPETSLKTRKSSLNVAMLHSLNACDISFFFRAYLNPNPYTVHSFLANQGLTSQWFLPFHILLIERSCMLWLTAQPNHAHHVSPIQYIILSISTPLAFFWCLSLQYLKHNSLIDWQETFKAGFHTGLFRQ